MIKKGEKERESEEARDRERQRERERGGERGEGKNAICRSLHGIIVTFCISDVDARLSRPRQISAFGRILARFIRAVF